MPVNTKLIPGKLYKWDIVRKNTLVYAHHSNVTWNWYYPRNHFPSPWPNPREIMLFIESTVNRGDHGDVYIYTFLLGEMIVYYKGEDWDNEGQLPIDFENVWNEVHK